MKVRCIAIPVFWGDMLTLGKEYDVFDVEDDEYWIMDDKGYENPVPRECFKVVSK